MSCEPCRVIELYPVDHHAPTLRRQVVESVRRVEHRRHVAPPEDWSSESGEREAHLWRAGIVVLACLVLGLLIVVGAAVVASVGGG